MIQFASPLLSARQIERRLSWLPCAGPCGRPGPHPIYPSRVGGQIALCEPCRELIQAEVTQNITQEVADSLEVAHG